MLACVDANDARAWHLADSGYSIADISKMANARRAALRRRKRDIRLPLSCPFSSAREPGVFSYAFRSGMFHGLNQVARHHNSVSGPIARRLWYALALNLIAKSL
jgi:hypothetical protein